MDYLDTKQAAELLGCSPSQISNLVRSRRLKAIRPGCGFRFRKEWIDAFYEEEAQRFQAELLAADAQPERSKRGSRRVLPDLERYAG